MGGKAMYLLGLDVAKTVSPISPCPHSDGTGAPSCWDCIEEGHVTSPRSARRGSISSTWQKFGRFRDSLAFMDANFSKITLSSTGTQVLPEGGLEVVHGPQLVSLEEKLRGLKPKGSNPEVIDEEDIVSNLESNPESGALPEPTQTIWGIRKRTFWIFVVIVILVLLGLVVGIAVGVTQQKGTHSTSLEKSGSGQVSSSSPSLRPTTITQTVFPSASAAGASSTSRTLSEASKPSPSHKVGDAQASPGTTAARGGAGYQDPAAAAPTSPTNVIPSQPISTVSSSPPAATTPASTSPSSRICLGDDGSTYTDPGTGDKFKIECDVSHNGEDIVNLEAQTMQACISLCAKSSYCKGASWYNVGPQGTDLNYCWLKSGMGSDVRITPDAQSVIRL